MRDSLLLWDIDGTLIFTDRAGERALLALSKETYGHDFQGKLPISLQGRTDSSIARDFLGIMGVAVTPEEVKRFMDGYIALLPRMLAAGTSGLHPGVKAALDAVHAHPEIHQGLLTGNQREGARLKLSHTGIWQYFEFGAYADDSHDRNALGPYALRRAKEKLGIDFPPDRVFIIGDTPLDVACGQAIGAKTIAVATGHYSVAELEASGATHTFPNLLDTDAFLKVVL